ncbi:hypothetical protein Q3G72_004473 [Acer saccharum]|nr:hypothetical protein Q3G72_004473 [Acer saccharum]
MTTEASHSGKHRPAYAQRTNNSPHQNFNNMEGNLENSSKLGCPVDDFDTKYISGLSTILVDTIQEAKDRIH